MEKTSGKQPAKLILGLLIFLAEPAFLFAKAPSRSVIKSLSVKPDKEVFFTAQENGYTLKIPEAEPSSVQTDFTDIPQGVQFLSSKREEYFDNDGKRGTLVHLWFSFKDPGTVRLPPLITVIAGKTYYIPFEDAVVYENPALISPEADVLFLNGILPQTDKDGAMRIYVNAGEEIAFVVGLRYFVQIVEFRWTLPKDSIFEETERYEALQDNFIDREFSTQAKPLARFSWKPLVPGEYSLPDIKIQATAYNGTLKAAGVPSCIVKVLPASSSSGVQKGQRNTAENVFKSAFTEKQSPSPAAKSKVLDKQSAELASMRSAERNSFPWGNARKDRRMFEKDLGVYQGENEPSRPLAVLLLVAAVVFAALSVLLAAFRVFKLSVAAIAAGAACIVVCVFSFARLAPAYGVFAGGAIASVPEENTSSFIETAGAVRVRIKEKTDGYYYIEAPDINGWAKKELVYEIR